MKEYSSVDRCRFVHSDLRKSSGLFLSYPTYYSQPIQHARYLLQRNAMAFISHDSGQNSMLTYICVPAKLTEYTYDRGCYIR